MIFTDLRFLVLFGCCWVSFFAVAPARRSAVLAAWGIVFYAVYAGLAVVLVFALIAGAAFSNRRGVAWISGAAVCGLLAFFKIAGIGRWVVPLGFSYLSFELLHVIVERRRGRIASV